MFPEMLLRFYVLLPAGIFIGLLYLVFPALAHAQDEDNTTIGYGETVNGTLDNDRFRSLYTFSGRQGEIITITMIATGGDLDPYLSLVDSSGRSVAFSDDNGDGNAAFIDSIRLSLDGSYFIIATRFGHGQGSTTGEYELQLQRLGATTSPGATIQFGDSIIGEITDDSPQVVYVFSGQRGEVIDLRMLRTSGNLDTLIDLANAQGQILRSGDDDPSESGTLNAAIMNYTLPESGYYIIVATRYGRRSGETRGSFLLTLTAIPRDLLGRSPANAILMDYGAEVRSSISAEVPQRFYFFEGRRGEVVSIQMERTQGNLQTVAILLDEDLNELARDGGNQPLDRARITGYSLSKDGDYYIMATRVDFSDGSTAGDFALTLEGRSGIGGSAFLEIVYDTEVTGVISDELPYETFIFQGDEGDIVTIRMDATSDNLDPLLTLYQDGKQIVFDDDSGDGKNAAIIDFRLPEDGVYQIEAARFNRAEGETTGGYILTLEEG